MPLNNSELIQQLVQRELKKSSAIEEFMPKQEYGPSLEVKPIDPSKAMLLGGLADAASTYTFLKRGTGREANKAFKYFNNSPESVIPTAAATGLAYHLLNKFLKPRAPKLANTLAGLVGGYQMALGGNNFENTFDGKPRSKSSYSKTAEDFRSTHDVRLK